MLEIKLLIFTLIIQYENSSFNWVELNIILFFLISENFNFSGHCALYFRTEGVTFSFHITHHSKHFLVFQRYIVILIVMLYNSFGWNGSQQNGLLIPHVFDCILPRQTHDLHNVLNRICRLCKGAAKKKTKNAAPTRPLGTNPTYHCPRYWEQCSETLKYFFFHLKHLPR